jgi:hypothetical protein
MRVRPDADSPATVFIKVAVFPLHHKPLNLIILLKSHAQRQRYGSDFSVVLGPDCRYA